MNTSIPKSGRWQHSLTRSGYFVGALLLHLIAFFMLATWIIFKAPIPQNDGNFRTVAIAPPPPPPPAPPSAAGGDAANNFEPSAETVPAPSVPSIVATSNLSDFAIKSVAVAIPNLPAATAPPSGSGLSGHDAPGQDVGSGSPFGSADSGNHNQFEGYLYDLKQTRDGQSTNMDPGLYEQKILQFINSDWDEGVFRDFYKSPKELSTSSIFVPVIHAEDGPKAFGVENEVKPNMYCVLYKVTASPPEDGTYHFVGTADDIMFVRVNGKTVLDGTDYGIDHELRDKEKSIQMTDFHGTFPNNEQFWIGLPFHASAHESVDIEVLIGEEPGGKSDYFLFIQREESTYPSQPNGSPLLPIFQLDDKPIHPNAAPGSFPPSAPTPYPWSASSDGM